MTSPVIQADSSDAKNTSSGAISVTRPSRPSGVFPASTAPAPPSKVPAATLPSVSVWPGSMALTRILRGASSSANPLVSVSMEPFVEAYSRAPPHRMRTDDGAEVDDAAAVGPEPLDRLLHGENRPENVDVVMEVKVLFSDLREGAEPEYPGVVDQKLQ